LPPGLSLLTGCAPIVAVGLIVISDGDGDGDGDGDDGKVAGPGTAK
jgi:hypothetical protein